MTTKRTAPGYYEVTNELGTFAVWRDTPPADEGYGTRALWFGEWEDGRSCYLDPSETKRDAMAALASYVTNRTEGN